MTQRPVLSEARVPKYYDKKRQLADLVDRLSPGTALPPERVLATQFAVSRTTLRQALRELVAEGLLERAQGRGTFVAQPKVVHAVRLAVGPKDTVPRGSSQLLAVDRTDADAETADRLGLPPGGGVLRIEQLVRHGVEPMAVQVTWLAARRHPGLLRRLERHLTGGADELDAALHEAYGERAADGEAAVQTVFAEPREAALLDTAVGSPLLLLSRHVRDTDGIPVEWSRIRYRGDRFALVLRLR